MSFDIVKFLLAPAEILTQGMVGLILGLGINAMQIWLMYEVIVLVPPRAKNLVDAIDMELSQTQYFSGLKYRIYSAILQVFLPLILICVCYLSFCLFTGVVTDLF
ncbi:hypothetical protein EU527_04540 [Candidatus Thorarchaeota archaeon]|nr:MAG: hypothetical protein EU527_04540 [Candidatus Thorarchaeota archaeon]